MCTVYWYKNDSIINELFNFEQIRWYRKAGIPTKWYGARRTSRTGCAAPALIHWHFGRFIIFTDFKKIQQISLTTKFIQSFLYFEPRMTYLYTEYSANLIFSHLSNTYNIDFIFRVQNIARCSAHGCKRSMKLKNAVQDEVIHWSLHKTKVLWY